MAMGLGPRVAASLKTLFSRIETGEDSYPPVYGVTIGIRPGETFTLRGDAYNMLHDIAETLAGPATSAAGPSLKAARDLILSACRHFLDEGESEALQWLDSVLHMPAPTWTVIRPTTLIQRADEIVIGRCLFRRGLPPNVGEVNDRVVQAFPAFTVAATVEARDQETAKLLAEFEIAESFGVVQLSDRGRVNFLGGATLLVKDDGTKIFSPAPSAGASLDHLVVEGGNLRPYFQPLSAALVKAASARTDWERRTIAAARWLSKSLSVPWPSDSLVSQMVALEALFVPPGWGSHKGRRIAQEATKRTVLRGMTKPQQEAWMEGLYQRRNATVHEAGSFDDEIEIDRLADVTWSSVSWAASHLSPNHRADRHPCQTQTEALTCFMA